MIWVARAVVIGQVATHTRSGRAGVIPFVALVAIVGNESMPPGECIIIVMDRERGWFPARVSRMTAGACSGNANGTVAGVCSLVISRGVAG